MRESDAINTEAMDSIERRVNMLEHGFVAADPTSTDDIETAAEPDTEPAAEDITATADTTATDDAQ